MYKIKKPVSGFSMIELLVVLAIMAIMLRFAVPFFGKTISNNRVSSVATSMAASLSKARSFSVMQPPFGFVSLVPGSGTGVSASSSSTNQWSNGWREMIRNQSIAGAALSAAAMQYVPGSTTQPPAFAAATAPTDQVYLGYASSATSGISVTLQLVGAGTNNVVTGTPNPPDAITFNPAGELVDDNGNRLAGKDMQVLICDNGLPSGTPGKYGRRITITMHGGITNFPPGNSLYSNPCP